MANQAVGARDQAQRSLGPSAPGLREILPAIRLSFDAGEQGAVKIRFPFKARIDILFSQVVKALSATNAGTVTPSNNVGNMANGTLSHALSSGLGAEEEKEPSTNRIIAKGSNLTLTPAKTTAGGQVQVTIHYTRMA